MQAPVLANCEEKKPHVNLPSSYLSANFSTANPFTIRNRSMNTEHFTGESGLTPMDTNFSLSIAARNSAGTPPL